MSLSRTALRLATLEALRPTASTPIANLGDDELDWIAGAYADVTSLNSARDLLSDAIGRWSSPPT